MDIKPIETVYNGYRFRSRLEARWAVFFDALGVKYEYELEGYCMSDGSCYLPDFFLPDIDYYVEVKGKNKHIVEDMTKLKKFVLESKTAVIILSDIPYDPSSRGLFWFPIIFFTARNGGVVDGCYACFYEGWRGAIIHSDFYIGYRKKFFLNIDGYGDEENERIFRLIQPIFGSQLDSGTFGIKDAFEAELMPVECAFTKARQARFEHGETPAVSHG